MHGMRLHPVTASQLDEPDLSGETLPRIPECALRGDSDLVARAVDQIRTMLHRTLNRCMDEVGQYLLREFYDDDPEFYRSTRHGKHASLRLLEERCESLDLPVRRTFLSNALQMAALSRELPPGSPFLSLPPSHRIELLKLRRSDRLDLLATRAVENRLSVQKLRELVRRERARTRSTRGRKPVPNAVRHLRACVRLLRDETTGRLVLRRDDIDQLNPDQLTEVRALTDSLSRRIEELLKLLG